MSLSVTCLFKSDLNSLDFEMLSFEKKHAYQSLMRNCRPIDKLEGMQGTISDGVILLEEAEQSHIKTSLTRLCS